MAIREMPRARRFVVAGGVYHVTVRGNNRQRLFHDQADHQRYVVELRRCLAEHACALLAYALMPNHVHLVLHDQAGRLSRFMQALNSRYTRYVNQRYRRVGQLYQGRFYARWVGRDEYLLEVTRYVHLNPVRARLVDKPADYPWSSYHAYISRGREHAPLVDTKLVWSLMDKGGAQAPSRYQAFVESMSQRRFASWERRLRRLNLIGSSRFAHEMNKYLAPNEAH